MKTPDPYELWRQARRDVTPSEVFSERVMAAVIRAHARRQEDAARRLVLIAWLARRRRGLLLLAGGAAFALRLAGAFSFFVAS